MSSSGSSSRRSQLRLWALVAAAVCASALCLVDFGARGSAAAVSRARLEVRESPPVATQPSRTSLTAVARREPELGSVSPQLTAAYEQTGEPHPITPEHQRIQRELGLIQALNDALDLEDAAQMRPLIAVYAREYPDDANALRAGYERITDCLEDPGGVTREAARNYYEHERASTLRRYVRRICLER
jgi:hypothetical protein